MNKVSSGAKADRTNAVVTGVFFVVATAAAITGLSLYDPILTHADYLTLGAGNANRIISGAVFHLILAGAAAGTGIMLFPYLRKINESLGLGYVCFRLLEVVFILVGTVSVLSLLTLSRSYTHATAPEIAAFQTTGTVLKAIHDWTFILGPNFMLGINTFMYSYLFYQSKLVPRKIAVTGIAGAVLIFIAALLEMFGVIGQLSGWGVLLAIPVFAYELILAGWLISKGFNLESPAQKI